MEAESYLSLSAVQPLVKGIIRALSISTDDSDYAKSFKEAAVEELLLRFDSLSSPLPSDPSAIPMALRASALDIRFHKLHSLAGRQARDIRLSIENELVASGGHTVAASVTATVSSEPRVQTAVDQNAHATVGSLLNYLKERSGESSNDDDSLTIEANAFTARVVRHQMANFVSQSQQSHDVDLLQWWKTNETRFKSASRAARKYLAIPATSAPSERVFSLSGSICNPRPASLSPENLDALVFLNANSLL